MNETAQHTSMSLGGLVDVVIQQGLVEQCTLTRDSLIVVLHGRTLTYGWNEGQQFCRLLLAGASRTGAPLEHAGLERERVERTGPVREPVREPVEYENGTREHADPASLRRPDLSPHQGRLRDDYLDTMLTFAAHAGFIEGFDKDRKRGKVTLRTQATTTDLSFSETLEYLTSVVLDELSAPPPAPVMQEEPSGRRGSYTAISVLPGE